MKKYVTIKVGSIIVQIGIEISPGYTEGVIECFLPDEGKLTDA